MRTICQSLGLVVAGLLTGLLTGCVGNDGRLASTNPSRRDRGWDASAAPAASTQAATRVHTVGHQVLAANAADFPTRPVFFTIGLNEPMIFHRNPQEIIISEGLVERCATDGELAAVISHELARMTVRWGRPGSRDREPPPAPRLTPDVVGGGQPADMTRLAEEARFDRQRTGRDTRGQRLDPRVLAQSYLTRAGHQADDLDRVEPLLQQAAENAANRDILRGR